MIWLAVSILCECCWTSLNLMLFVISCWMENICEKTLFVFHGKNNCTWVQNDINLSVPNLDAILWLDQLLTMTTLDLLSSWSHLRVKLVVFTFVTCVFKLLTLLRYRRRRRVGARDHVKLLAPTPAALSGRTAQSLANHRSWQPWLLKLPSP